MSNVSIRIRVCGERERERDFRVKVRGGVLLPSAPAVERKRTTESIELGKRDVEKKRKSTLSIGGTYVQTDRQTSQT